MKPPPPMPRTTCPDIDDVIRTLEKLRSANDALRLNAEYYMEECSKLEDEIKEKDVEIEDLESDLDELQSQGAES